AAERVVGGIGWEVADNLLRAGVAFERPNTYGAGTGVTYEPDHLRVLWDRLLEEAGAHALLHTPITRVVMDGETVQGVIAETSRGPGHLRARVVIDATGDAEVAWRAGAAVEKPERGRRLQPLTATFRMMNVEVGQ